MCEIVNDAMKENGCLTMQEAGSFAQKILGKDTVCLSMLLLTEPDPQLFFKKSFYRNIEKEIL